MKRTLIALLTFFVAHIAWSQGDTVRYMDPWYKFNPYDKELVYPGSIDSYTWNSYAYMGRTVIHTYVWSPGDTIFGVAITMDTIIIDDENFVPSNPEESTFIALLFEKSGWMPHGPMAHLVDSVGAKRSPLTRRCFFDYGWVPDTERVQPCTEFYFDTPHTSFNNDTFFVGYDWPSYHDSVFYRLRYALEETEADMTTGTWALDVTNHYTQTYPLSSNMNFYGQWFTNIFSSANNTCRVLWGGMFPIVKLRCSRPPVLTLEEHTDNSQRVSWTMGSDGGYQLSIGPYGSAPAEGEVVTVYGNEYTFDTEADSIYSAWVRRSCRYTTASYDTLVWGEWSHPVTFRTAVSGGGSDTLAIDGNLFVEEAVVTARKGCIAVQGLAQGEQAEVYDMKGCRVATVTADREVCVPVPAGVYMVRLLSRHGSSHRRVVVTR
jgi:hypothetical protein